VAAELITNYGLTDIVAERYDAGVRAREQVAKDMIAARAPGDSSFQLAVIRHRRA
jgi:hypothetical protein